MSKLKVFNALTLLILAVLVFIFFGYKLIRKNEKAIISQAIEAVPVDAAIITEIPDVVNSLKKIKKNNTIVQQIFELQNFSELKKEFADIDTIVEQTKILKNILKSEKLIISAHLDNSANFQFLFLFKVAPVKKQRQLVQEMIALSDDFDTVNNVQTYSNTDILTLKINEHNYYFTIVENIAMFSESDLLMKSAIRQKLADNPITLDLGFKETSALSKNNIHIYINYNNLSTFSSRVFVYKFAQKTKKIKNIAKWTSFDVDFAQNNISLNGLTYTSKTSDSYLNIFKDVQPQTMNLLPLIPIKTSQFLYISFDDLAKFYSNYEKYVSSKNLTATYQQANVDFKQKYKVNPQLNALQYIGNSITFLKVRFNKVKNTNAEFIILQLRDQAEFKLLLDKINSNSQEQKNFKYELIADNSKKFTFYELTAGNLMNILFGELTYFPEMKYYFLVGDFVIFSKSKDDLKLYISDVYRKKTLNENQEMKKYFNSISLSSNLLFFYNNNFNNFNTYNLLTGRIKDLYKKNMNFFNKFQFITLQYTYMQGNIFQTQLNAFYNPQIQTQGITSWETELSDNIAIKPLFFINHNTYEKEIFVQDKDTIIYLINNKGEILWRKKLKEFIVGDVYMVDLYNNGKKQLLFATTTHLLALDRNGHLVGQLCQLPDTTKFGITVVDYDGKNDYRIFVPCVNQTVYLYDKQLQPVEGWGNPQTETPIVSKVFYYPYEDKDYLVFAEKYKLHIVNRRGEDRINVAENIAFPEQAQVYFQKPAGNIPPRFVTSDAAGSIKLIDLNGKVTTQKILVLQANHKFVAADLNADNILDYIFANNKTLFVYSSEGKQIFTYTFGGKVSEKPIILKFSKNDVKIGITVAEQNKIYIFNSNGTIFSNFPTQGNSAFSVGFFDSKQHFSLIVGNNNFVYNYSLIN